MLFTFDAPANVPNAGGAAASPVAYLADGREFIVNAFGGNVPDRSITSDGNCLGGGTRATIRLAMHSLPSPFRSIKTRDGCEVRCQTSAHGAMYSSNY
jgi:hypothetical protein